MPENEDETKCYKYPSESDSKIMEIIQYITLNCFDIPSYISFGHIYDKLKEYLSRSVNNESFDAIKNHELNAITDHTARDKLATRYVPVYPYTLGNFLVHTEDNSIFKDIDETIFTNDIATDGDRDDKITQLETRYQEKHKTNFNTTFNNTFSKEAKDGLYDNIKTNLYKLLIQIRNYRCNLPYTIDGLFDANIIAEFKTLTYTGTFVQNEYTLSITISNSIDKSVITENTARYSSMYWLGLNFGTMLNIYSNLISVINEIIHIHEQPYEIMLHTHSKKENNELAEEEKRLKKLIMKFYVNSSPRFKEIIVKSSGGSHVECINKALIENANEYVILDESKLNESIRKITNEKCKPPSPAGMTGGRGRKTKIPQVQVKPSSSKQHNSPPIKTSTTQNKHREKMGSRLKNEPEIRSSSAYRPSSSRPSSSRSSSSRPSTSKNKSSHHTFPMPSHCPPSSNPVSKSAKTVNHLQQHNKKNR